MCAGSPGAAGDDDAQRKAKGKGCLHDVAAQTNENGKIRRPPGSKRGGRKVVSGEGRKRYDLRSGASLVPPSSPSARPPPSKGLDNVVAKSGEDFSGATPPFDVAGCKNKSNPYHKCSEYCRDHSMSVNPNSARPEVSSDSPPLQSLDSQPGSNRFSFGDSEVVFSKEPVDFNISDGCIDAIAEDLGAHSVVVRCLHKRPPVASILDWINCTWSNLPTPAVESLDFGFFLITFCSVEDCNFVLQNGPWFFGHSGLFISPWSPFFDPATAKITCIPIWIRLYNLPLVLRKVELLSSLINQVGSFVKLDPASVASDCRFYRVCALVDISKTLSHSIRIHSSHGVWTQFLNYEGLPFRCFRCNKLGHKIDACTLHRLAGARNVCLKKWVQKKGSPDTDFIWRNHGMFFEPSMVSGLNPDQPVAPPSPPVVPASMVNQDHPVVPAAPPTPIVECSSVSSEEEEDDGSNSEGTFPFMDEIEDPFRDFDDDFTLDPPRKLGIYQSLCGKSKPDCGSKRKVGRKSDAEKLRIEGMETVEAGSQKTLEALLRTKRRD